MKEKSEPSMLNTMMDFYGGFAKLTFLLPFTLLQAWKISRNSKRAIQEQKEENKEKAEIAAKAVNEKKLTKHQNYLEEILRKNQNKNSEKEDTVVGSKPIKEAAILESGQDPPIKEKLRKIEQDVKKVYIFVNTFSLYLLYFL